LIAAIGVLSLALLTAKSGAAETGSPIEDLKKALNTDRGLARVNQAAHDRRVGAIHAASEALTSVGDLGDALMLPDWQLEIGTGGVRGDRELWNDLAQRFHTSIKTVLETKHPIRQQAASLLLADIGANTEAAARNSLAKTVLTPLTTTLAQLASDASNELNVRLAAIQALGKLNPLLIDAPDVRTPTPEANDIKPEVLDTQAAARAEARKRLDQAIDAIGSLLKPGNPVEARRAAARAITDLTRSVGEQDRTNERVAELQTMNDIEIYRAYTTLVQTAVRTLNDADEQVRETGVGAIASVAKTVDDRLQSGSPLDRYYLPNSTLPADQQKKLADQQNKLGEAIQGQVLDLQTALGGAVATHKEGSGIGLGNLISGDPSAKVRFKAVDAIRELALLYRRVRPLERPTVPPPVPSGSQVKLERPVVQVAQKPAPAPSEPVFEGLQSAAASLPAAFSDSNAKTRITAAEAIELLGPAVVAGVPGISEALVAALSDRDRFVRWAAARTISKLGFISAQAAVPPLARMLVDPDFDLQMVATTTLAEYGPQAKAAVPNLIRAVERGDSDVRTSAMRTLAAIGTDGAAAVPATTRALRDEKPQTRKQAADLLGRFGPLAESAIPALKQATQDDNVDVRRAAAQSILNITRK
jgi:hypothetical protein